MKNDKTEKPQLPIPPEELELLRQLMGYLESKLKVGIAIYGTRLSEISEEKIYNAITNVEEGEHLFGRLKALPDDRFALLMDAMMLTIILRGASASHEQDTARIWFEEVVKQPRQ